MLIVRNIQHNKKTEYWCFIVTYHCHVLLPQNKKKGGGMEGIFMNKNAIEEVCMYSGLVFDI